MYWSRKERTERKGKKGQICVKERLDSVAATGTLDEPQLSPLPFWNIQHVLRVKGHW